MNPSIQKSINPSAPWPECLSTPVLQIIPVSNAFSWQSCHDELVTIRGRLDLMLKHLTNQAPPPALAPAQENIARAIIKLVSFHTGISQKAILGQSRREHIAWARQLAMAFAHKYSHLKLIPLGNLFAKHHKCILNATERVAERTSTDKHANLQYQTLEAKIIQHLTP